VARINIEDSLFKDLAFTDLVIKLQCRTLALGAVMEAFMLAQKWYLDEAHGRLIPADQWARFRFGGAVLECGLAEAREGGIYVRGSDEQFKWLLQRQVAGKKGGLAKSHKTEMTVAVAKRKVAVAKPLTLTLPLTPKDNNKTLYDSGESHREEFNLEQIYQEYPRRRGQANKGKGIEKLKKLIKSRTDFELALAAVRGYRLHLISQQKINTEFVKMFSSFWDAQGDWKEWAAARPSDGAEITDKLIAQAKGDL
jgi:hypothetical protein